MHRSHRSHRSHLALAALAVVAAGIAAVPLAASAGSGPKRVSLALTETSTGFHFIDAPAAPEDGQAGDLITFESALSDRSGNAVGSLAGQCTQLRADGTLDDCGVTVTVGGDSYRMAGLFDPATGGTLAIVGGTGRWVGAGGTDTIVNQPDGTALHTINLVRP